MGSHRKMSENPKAVNLDMEFKTISKVVKEVSMIEDVSIKLSKFDYHIHLLEEEMKKVDAFKRELPYCMQLLRDAIETLRKECQELRQRDGGGVREELIPIPLQLHSESSNSIKGDKRSWVSRVRLWTAPVHFHNGIQTFPLKTIKEDGKRSVDPATEVPVPVEAIHMSLKDDPNDAPNPSQKKQRRCWSPELHNLFVDALLNLGGPYVATPKQIREQMKVEGLTNDEVKSHLQKYRLHIRKIPSSSTGVIDASLTTVAPLPSPENHLQKGGFVANQDVLKF